MKKITAFVLVLVICLGSFASCNNTSPPQETLSEQSSVEESSKAQESSKTEESSKSEEQSSEQAPPSEEPTCTEESSVTDEPPVKEYDNTLVNLADGAAVMEPLSWELDEKFISSQMKVSLELFKASVDKSQNENVFISPLSIQLALAMTANGANGQTKSEMESVLSHDIPLEELNEYLRFYTDGLPSSENAKLGIANSIWIKNGFDVKSDFLKNAISYFRADIYRGKFDNTTANSINKWAEEKTDSMIDEIINEIPEDAVMYLINAIVFDAKWEAQFDEELIYDSIFTNISGEEKQVEMMYRDNEYMYIETENATGFKKDYKGGDYSFVALLPGEDVSINDYIASLDAQTLLDTLSSVKNSGEGIIRVPKFEYEYELEMKELLSELGMPTAFSPEGADFSDMSSVSTYISRVLHKTYISVDNAGTRAAAVTVAEMGDQCVSEISWNVTLNRPFVYMIVDNATSLPIFIGVVMDI